MKQEALRKSLEAILDDLRGGYLPGEDVSESIVDWLVGTALAAAFGEQAVELSHEGALLALGNLEAVVREPLRLEARITRGRSKVRYPGDDFFVEFSAGGELMARGADPVLSLAIMHAVRALARR